jgi:acetyl esterase/lipase
MVAPFHPLRNNDTARVFYMLDGHDPRDPRISPAYADFDRFPRRVLIVTAAYDSCSTNVGKA